MYAGRLTLLLVAVLATLLHAGHAACKTDWVAHDDFCYIFGQDKVNWIEAVALCKAYGGDLVEIRSAAENTWIISEIKEREMSDIWLGTSDIFGEGTWKWISDGEPLSAFSKWGKNEPSNGHHLKRHNLSDKVIMTVTTSRTAVTRMSK